MIPPGSPRFEGEEGGQHEGHSRHFQSQQPLFALQLCRRHRGNSNRRTAAGLTIRYEFTDPTNYRIRTFLGKLVKAKDKEGTDTVAQRILAMNVDVLAVQEVEDIDILKEFNRKNLKGLYPHQVLIEGNDSRFIDIGLLSKLPLGTITSFQTAVHHQTPGERVFSRDLAELR